MYQLRKFWSRLCNCFAALVYQTGLADRVFLQPFQNFLDNQKPTKRILVVCHGNICRSPYLEIRLKELLPQKNIECYSAGIHAPGGDSANATAQEIAIKRGVDLSQHRTTALSQDAISNADLIIIMEPRHRRELLEFSRDAKSKILYAGALLLPVKGKFVVRDPYGHDNEFFEDCFDQLDALAKEFAKGVDR